MRFKTGDEIIISRGTYRNQAATVVEASEAKEQYAVKLPGGVLTVVNAKNIRVPAEVTISASDLAEVLSAYRNDVPVELFESLEIKVPGITNGLSWIFRS